MPKDKGASKMKDWGPLPEDHDYSKYHGIALDKICVCKFCGDTIAKINAHLHQDTWVCEECWDERLRITE